MTRRRIYTIAIGLPILAFCVIAGCIHLQSEAAFRAYDPKNGDLIFQSLPPMDLVVAIEGITESPYSHCGIVVRKDDQWQVLEAIGPVRYIPLRSWIRQGREHAFSVYRLQDHDDVTLNAMIKGAEGYLGRPYDSRYRMDDERIYCSELIYKGYRDGTGKELAQLETLGSLNWQPYERTVRKYEGGEPPLDRDMITPVALTRLKSVIPVISTYK